MGSYWPKLGSKDQRDPIQGQVPRLKNIAFNNFRGILGALFPLLILTWQIGKGKAVVQCMWLLMFWFFIVQPIAVPATGCIPIWLLPMGGALSTVDTTKCYFNEGIALFILSSMLILLLNNSGFDRRMALFFMCSGDSCQFSGKRMIFKCSLAAFLLSMFSNRLIVTTTLLQYVTPIYVNMRSTIGKSPTEPNYDEMRYIINNAIQTSSAIGSTAIMYSAYCTLAFRTIWVESCLGKDQEYPDIFNFLEYTFFALPVAFTMFVLNFTYHMILMEYVVGKPMSAASMTEVKSQMLKHKSSIPNKVTSHEKITVFFTFLAMLLLFLRWNKYSNMGWCSYNQNDGKPVIKDCTVVAIFVLGMHVLPRGLNFLQFLTAEKRSQLKDLKPESSILFWRFVNMNTVYGYFLLLGGGVALNLAVQRTELYKDLTAHFGKGITGLSWPVGLFFVCLIAAILANVMTGVAAVVIFLPFVLNMARDGVAVPWEHKVYLPALGVGIASSFGFMWPFMYTPAYMCHHIGKVPMLKMAKYSVFSVLMCCVILWFYLLYWGPYLWDPEDKGIRCALAAVVGATTPAPGTGGGGEGGGGEGGGGEGGGGEGGGGEGGGR